LTEINGGPTGREWGTLTTEVKKLSYDMKNLRTSINLMADEIDKLESSLSSLQTKIYTTIAVCATFASIVAFIIQQVQ